MVLEIGRMYGTRRSLAILAAMASLVACSDSTGVSANAQVSVQDDCDPASFNAALGAGTCSRQGGTTLAAFNSELNASHMVAAWKFTPAALTISVGQKITAMNNGGEVHTFTEVAQFGGGIVPALNQASGNTVEAPECAQLTATDQIAAGGRFTTDAATDAGTERYQCCIHPWMRAVVTVRG
jgi:plastocyanin